MMVLVDTAVWSLALRRRQADLSPEQVLKTALQERVQDGRVQIVGPVRQKLLSAIRAEKALARCGTFCGPSTNPNSGSRITKKQRLPTISALPGASPGRP
jgi:hypothetical protein